MSRAGPAILVLLAAITLLIPYLAAEPGVSDESELARWYGAHFPSLGWQAEWGGGSPTWMAGSPGLPILTALAARVGLSVERAGRWIAGMVWALGALGALYLARSWRLPAGWTAFAVTIAPYRWADLTRDGNGSYAAALALLPFVLLPWVARRWVLAVAAALGWLLFLPIRWSWLPSLELALAFGAGWLARRSGRTAPIAACVGLFAAGLSWKAIFERPNVAPPVSRATLEWVKQHAPGQLVLGLPAPAPSLNPIRRQAEELILGPGRRQRSLLWLQALGVSHLLIAPVIPALEPEYEDASGYRLYQTPVRRPGPAVLVSRYQWKALPRITSLYHRTALAAYVEWANRPEAAGFRWRNGRQAEIRADLGPDDMILVRYNAAPGWSAAIDERPVPWVADPIGFLLLDPARTGPVTIMLSAPVWTRPATQPLPTRPVPLISEGGIRDGVRHTPPPFAPGTIISIYGEDLGGAGPSRVLVRGQLAEVLYAGERQVNARLPAGLPPGSAEVVVERAGARSNVVTVEIQ